MYTLRTCPWILLNKLLHQRGVAWRWSARGSAEVLWKPRFASIVAFSSSVWLGLMSLIFLLTIQHRYSVGFRPGQLAGPVIPWSVHPLLVILALWEGPNAFGKGYPHFHKACQHTEAQSALKSLGRWLCWLWTWSNRVHHHQQYNKGFESPPNISRVTSRVQCVCVATVTKGKLGQA